MSSSLTRKVCVTNWQLLVMLGLSGFALGTILARITDVLGF